MKLFVKIGLLLGITLRVVATYSYFYESSSTGLLPVITYPLRPYALPLFAAGLVLLSLGIVIHRFSSEDK
jgi:uncharacterized membrane protein